MQNVCIRIYPVAPTFMHTYMFLRLYVYLPTVRYFQQHSEMGMNAARIGFHLHQKEQQPKLLLFFFGPSLPLSNDH